jgi:arsenite transporter
MFPIAAVIAAKGRWSLIAGLVVGLGSPAAAEAVRPFVGVLVVAVLFLAFLRIGPAGLRIGRAALGRSVAVTLGFQLALPFAVALVLLSMGLLSGPLAMGAVLILSAAPITGAAPIAAMAGGDPAPALRQTVLGTMLLPLTVLPVFALAPAFGDAGAVFGTALRLLGVIAVAGGVALVLRARGIVPETREAATMIDAASAVLLGVVVVGLMAGAATALREDPGALALTLAAVSALGFGLQALTARLWRRPEAAAPMAVVAGNRNVALFLGVLPAPLIDELMLVIGCYQIPMYLTPLVLPWLLRLRRA